MSNLISQFVDQVEDKKIQITANGLNKTLEQAISDEDIGKPGGGLELLYTQTFKSLNLNTFTTGNNFNLSGGALAGTFAEETLDPLSGTRSLKYTQGVGSLNDFILSETLPVGRKFRGRRLVTLGNYTYKNGSNFDIQFLFYDVTNSTVKTVLSDALKSSDDAKIFRFYTSIPSNCTEYKWGFRVLSESAGAELMFDDFEFDTDPMRIMSLPVEDDIGRIEAFGTTTVPNGWMYCNGQAVSRTTYADLFARVGTNFGAGDGSTTFNLPDLRGEFLRGEDDGRGVDAGRILGSSQDDSIGPHSHYVSSFNDGGLINGGPYANGGARPYQYQSADSGTGIESETRPRNIAVRYYIKVSSLQRLYMVTNEGRGTIGEIISYVNDAAPDNFTYCDGSAVSRTDFSDLFAVMGTKFGIGDGSTTFNLPDMRGQFVRGVDDGRGLDPNAGARANGGDTIGSTQADATAVNGLSATSGNDSHYHNQGMSTPFQYADHAAVYGRDGSPTVNYMGATAYSTIAGTTLPRTSTDTHNHSITVNSSQTETRPTNIGLKFFVRYKKDPINVFAEVFDDYREVSSASFGNSQNDTWSGVTTIDLDPGVWDIGYEAFMYISNTSGSNANFYMNMALFDSTVTNNAVPETIALLAMLMAPNTSNGIPVSKRTRVEITQPTTYTLVTRANTGATAGHSFTVIGTGGFTGGLTDPDNHSKIWAKKVKDV